MYFRYFIIISLRKGRGPLFEQTWIPFTQRWIIPSLVEIGPLVLEKKLFLNVFLEIRNYLPLENAGPFIWINLNPLHPRMFCANFGWNWPCGSGEIFFKFCQCIFTIPQLSPLGKEHHPSFKQIWIPFTQEFYVPILVEIGPVILEKKSF